MIWADDTKVTCAIFMMDELPYNAITPIIGNKNCYNFDELGLDNLFELLYKQEVKVDLPVWNQLKNNVLSLIKLRIKSEYKAPRPNHRLVIQGPIAVQVGSVFKDISETGEYWNQHSWDIVFEKPFSSVPAVTVSINLLDEGTFIVNRDVKTSEGIKKTPTATIRIKVAAENITREGFTILANPWNINMLHGIGISWMAIGEA